ncbi:hypothetical protein F2P56_007238 [Juglans regia]|uniref:Reverse transcriptase domain-containing protein n=1 Tax=Juglans regia TaxID=51240 RepID=A0A833XZH8_JUGRE|nr:hypothetical protein F2P56_007238 [Juglans regia]
MASLAENEALCSVPTMEEVKSSLWSIPANSSPGPDGFSTSFFMFTWDVVKFDLLEMAKDFFDGQSLSTFFGPQIWQHSFGVALYLIIFLWLKNWFKALIERWGFFEKWRSIVFNAISSLVYSVLSRMINLEFSLGQILPFHPNGSSLITHLFYADDLLMFANGGSSAVRNIMEVLHRYELMSGQLINPCKSALFFSSSIPANRRNSLKMISGFEEGNWPCTYLGVPLFAGVLKIRMVDPLLAKVQKKLSGWKSKVLSFGGKIVLIKHVLNGFVKRRLPWMQCAASMVRSHVLRILCLDLKLDICDIADP